MLVVAHLCKQQTWKIYEHIVVSQGQYLKEYTHLEYSTQIIEQHFLVGSTE